jgi:sugar lactone lactonase YvrE
MSGDSIRFLRAFSLLPVSAGRRTTTLRSAILLATLAAAVSQLPGQETLTSGQPATFSSNGEYTCTGSGLLPECYLGVGLFNIAVPQGATELEVRVTLNPGTEDVFGKIALGSTMNHTDGGGWAGTSMGVVFPGGSLVYALAPTSTGGLALTPGTWAMGLDTSVVGLQTVSVSGTIVASVWFAVPPAITSVSPAAAVAGGGTFTLTVNGTGFVAASVVEWNGSPLATNFVSATQLTATVPAALIASLASVSITIQDTGGPVSVYSTPFIVAPATGNAYNISTVAGNGVQGYSGDGGMATSATANAPNGVAVDANGNLYIADSGNNCVRKVTPSGIITTVAGTGAPGQSGDGGPAINAMLSGPRGVAVDAAGNIYIADYGNRKIRKVTPGGTITTIAGTGTPGYSGDGGQATLAQLSSPEGLRVDSGGNLFFAEPLSSVIRKVAANGIISTVAGNGTYGYSADGVLATNAQLYNPSAVGLDAAGNIYFTDQHAHQIRKVGTNGILTTVAGQEGASGWDNGNGEPATQAVLDAVFGVDVDAAGEIFLCDSEFNIVREVTIDGTIHTIAGIGLDNPGYNGDGGLATSALLNGPMAVNVGLDGKVYVSDTNNNVIRLLTPLLSVPPMLTITKTHAGSFTQGQTNATYTVVVSNAFTAGPSSGTVTVSEAIPAGLTLVGMAGTGWSCQDGTCSRSDVLNSDASYPPITVTVNVASNAPAQVTNQVTLSGGGSASATATDPTRIVSIVLSGGTLPFGYVGGAYSTPLAGFVTGGVAPFTWAVTGGNLPGGLSLNSSTGVISGTPSASGAYSFQIEVTDSTGASSTASFQLTVTPVLVTLTASPNPIISASGSGMTTLTWSAPGYTQLVIVIGSPTGNPMTGTLGPAGSVSTGTWVTDGMQFFLVDLTANSAIASVTVHVSGVPSLPPVLTSISPNSAQAGSGSVTLQAAGSNFSSSSVVVWNTTSLATQFQSAALLQATVPASLLTSAGTAQVSVATGNLVSGSQPFTITQPPPPTVITFTANPNPIISGTGAGMTTLTWNAPGYTQLVILIGSPTGNPMTGTLGPSGSVPTGNWVTDGLQFFLVDLTTNSAIASLTVHVSGTPLLTPVLTSISPNTAQAGSGSITLQATGSNFSSSSVVVWNTTNLATQFQSAVLLQATVPASLLTNAGTAQVLVANGALVSGSQTFTITPGQTPPPSVITFTANPNPIIAASGVGMTTLTWNAPGYSSVVIRLTSPTGNAMTGSLPSSGSTPTGNWVTNGTQFFLVDANSGASLASLTVSVQPPFGVVNSMMAKSVNSNNACQIPTATTTFFETDPSAYAWFSVQGANAGDVPVVQWYAPSGTLYTSQTFNPMSAGSYCLWASIPIANSAPATMPGAWKVVVTWNGAPVLTLPFTILAGSSFSIQNAMLTKALSTSSGCVAPTATTAFLTTDATAFLWFDVSGAAAGDVPTAVWYSPGGTYYMTTTWNPLTSAGAWCFSGGLNIAGTAAASMPGAWQVAIEWNGSKVDTLSFTISSGSNGGSYDGQWSGTTSQGQPMSMTVANNNVTATSYGVNFPYFGSNCPTGATISSSTPIPITGSSFSSSTFSGTFQSVTQASGSLSWTDSVPGCSASGSLTWTATRQ